MDYIDIKDNMLVVPGEYLLHKPSRKVVLCGKYLPEEKKIKALKDGFLITEDVGNFMKISVSKKERRQSKYARKCGGCKK